MLRPPEAFRESMERARGCRDTFHTYPMWGEFAVGLMNAREDTRAILSTLRAAREREREMGVGK